MSQLKVSRRGRVALLTLSRPDHGNRVSQQMGEELVAALEEARRDANVGACVITGAGDVFCLGGDYHGAGSTTEGRMAFARAFIDMHHAMARLGKPLVAACNGNAHAGGFSILTACDLAVIADDATYGLPEAANGLFPFMALAVVKDIVPKKLLFDIVYNARLLTAAETCAAYLANEAVPRAAVLDRAIAVAERASAYDPNVIMFGRDLYYSMRGAGPVEALDQSRGALGSALAAADQRKSA